MSVICQPESKAELRLDNPEYDERGHIVGGALVAPNGQTYPIIDGVPRFVGHVSPSTVESFGDEWNHFNFTDHKANWLGHAVTNTFGSTDVFRGKLIVDAGGGSGAQTRWFLEYGARHVVLIDLSHAVDGVIRKNLEGFSNVDVVQASIDAPPLKDESVDGIVYCHNVIQHTPSVERTAAALFAITAPGGEFVFNCYPLNDSGFMRWVRWHLVYVPLRKVLSRLPFTGLLAYSHLLAALRLIPGVGEVLEKLHLVFQGEVVTLDSDTAFRRLGRRYRSACLNTFDFYGSHKYQWHKRDEEIRSLVDSLRPSSVLNVETYFQRPPPIGCALRLVK